MRILALFLDQDGRPETWMQRVTKAWKSTHGLIVRVATKQWGAPEKVTRTLALALLASNVYNYNRHTPAQTPKLERLNRKATRAFSRLPNSQTSKTYTYTPGSTLSRNVWMCSGRYN